MTQHVIKGTNDDVDTCSCCGRTNLKKVVWIAEIIDGVEQSPAAVGTTCASRMIRGSGGKVSKSEQNATLTLARAVQSAKKWFAKGYDAKTVATGIVNHYGYQVDTRTSGQISIGNTGLAVVRY
jgi:hypothetical protein